MTAEAKTKPEKISPENKRILDTIQNVFFKPTARRSPFLYCGFLGMPEHCYVFGSAPKEMEYGNPKQSLYMIHVKDPQMQADIKSFFARFHIDTTQTEVIALAALVSVVQKHKMQDCVSTYRSPLHELCITAPSLSEDRIVTTPYDSLFILNQFATTATGFLDTLLHKNIDQCFTYTIDLMDPKETLLYMVFPHSDFATTAVGQKYKSDLRVLLTRGIDWLIPKSLIKDTQISFTGLRFWIYSGSTLRYAFCVDTDKVDLIGTRCNVLLLPEK